MNHNSAERLETGEAVGTPDLPFRLSGSQMKTKHAIELNIESMAREVGIQRVGFLTLTLGDHTGSGFTQVFDGAEANRRVNAIARRFLPSLFNRWVIVTERHANGAIHFHLAVETRVGIRGVYDWDAVRRGDYRTAPDALKRLWSVLREELPKFGFGRAQLEPAKGCESLARYVAKYVEKNLFNRLDADKGKKLVRYGGWNGGHVKPNDFSWATPKACEWRKKAARIAALGGMVREDVAVGLGPRWAWRLTKIMAAVATKEDAEFMADWTSQDQADQAEYWLRQHVQNNLENWCRAHLEVWDRKLTSEESAELIEDLQNEEALQLFSQAA